jgi:hypothetical protein
MKRVPCPVRLARTTLSLLSGQEAPGGVWPEDPDPWPLASINQLGNAAFSSPITIGRQTSIGTFASTVPASSFGVARVQW